MSLPSDSRVCPRCKTRLKKDKTGKHFIGRQAPKSGALQSPSLPANKPSASVSPLTAIIIVAIVLGVVFVGTYKGCSKEGKNPSTLATSGPSAGANSQQHAPLAEVSFDVQSVTLNYQTRQMEIRGTLRSKGATRPDRVWIWAYYFAPSFSVPGSWSDEPIEITNPFAGGDAVQITAQGHFHWWDNPDTPKSGYYARVNVSARSAEDARVPTSLRNKSAEGAQRVRVE